MFTEVIEIKYNQKNVLGALFKAIKLNINEYVYKIRRLNSDSKYLRKYYNFLLRVKIIANNYD